MNFRRYWPLISVILVVYLFLTFSRAATSTPWNDEAWYTSPSRSLILYGDTGTPLLETAHMFWRGIHQRTYWVVPLQFYVQVPWILIFGFSLLKLRALAIVWGWIAICAWGYTVHKLTFKRSAALLAMLLIACDYQIDSQVSLARMDAMALAFASLSVSVYLALRERHFSLAVFFSQLFVVACGLTHPTPGVPAFVGMIFLTSALDFRRLRLQQLAVGLIPYLLGAAFWGWYISEAPDLFRAQFLGNVVDIDRLGGLTHPVRAVAREVLRYWGMAGFAPGLNPLYRFRLIVIVLYLAAVILLLSTYQLRKSPGIRIVLGLYFTYLLTFVFYEGTKEVKYALHIVCFYDVMVALAVTHLWQFRGIKRIIGVAGAAAILLVSIGGVLYSSYVKDDYHRQFLPAAEYIRSHAKPNDLILAGSEFGFPLGFDSKIVDDASLTYDSHKKPEYIVMNPNYRSVFARRKPEHVPIANYAEALLTDKYHHVWGNETFEILKRNDGD